MNQDTQPALPKYFKDGAGYCYGATPVLAKQVDLTPWDGDVDAKGFAVSPKEEAPKSEPKPAARSRGKAAE